MYETYEVYGVHISYRPIFKKIKGQIKLLVCKIYIVEY